MFSLSVLQVANTLFADRYFGRHSYIISMVKAGLEISKKAKRV